MVLKFTVYNLRYMDGTREGTAKIKRLARDVWVHGVIDTDDADDLLDNYLREIFPPEQFLFDDIYLLAEDDLQYEEADVEIRVA